MRRASKSVSCLHVCAQSWQKFICVGWNHTFFSYYSQMHNLCLNLTKKSFIFMHMQWNATLNNIHAIQKIGYAAANNSRLVFWGIFLNINSLHFLFWLQCGEDRKMLKSDPWKCVNNKERRPKLLSISIKKGIKLVNQWIQGKAPKITVGNIWFPDKCAAFKSFFKETKRPNYNTTTDYVLRLLEELQKVYFTFGGSSRSLLKLNPTNSAPRARQMKPNECYFRYR